MMPHMSEIPVSPGAGTPGEILDLVRSGQATTRTDLRRLTGLSRTAIVARVNTLVDAGLLLVGEELASTGGRPPGALVFNGDAGVVLAVAVGRSRSQLAIFDLEGRELAGDTRDHEVGVSAQELMPQVVERLGKMLDGVTPPVIGVGMSLPGVVDPERLVSVDSPVMGGWDGVPLAPYFAELTDAPVLLANDADTLATSELFGPGAHPRNALVLKASTGLGLGIVVDGKVRRGAWGAAGEIGHSPIEAAAGVACRCGNTGCLEAVAGGAALARRLTAAGHPAERSRDVVALVRQGDAVARASLRESGRYVGEVLAIAINMLNPETIVIGGDMGQAFDLYTAGVRESVYARATALATRDLTFVPATHGDSSGLVGCAAIAIEHVLHPVSVDAYVAARGATGPVAALAD
jgi:predicted NBD/HSP70 family sugar kinase